MATVSCGSRHRFEATRANGSAAPGTSSLFKLLFFLRSRAMGSQNHDKDTGRKVMR